MTGEVKLNEDLARKPLYQVYGLNSEYDQISLIDISLINDTVVRYTFSTCTSGILLLQYFRTLSSTMQTGIQKFGTFGVGPVHQTHQFVDFLENPAHCQFSSNIEPWLLSRLQLPF